MKIDVKTCSDCPFNEVDYHGDGSDGLCSRLEFRFIAEGLKVPFDDCPVRKDDIVIHFDGEYDNASQGKEAIQEQARPSEEEG